MIPDLTLQRLTYFVRIAQDLSLRQAAVALHTTQPSLSGHMRALERSLGVVLFERESRGLRLTAAGKQLVPQATRVVLAAERLQEYALNLASGEEGAVSIAAYPVHIERFLGAVIGEYKRSNTRIRVDLSRIRDDRRRGSGRSLFDELLQGEVDIAMGPPHPHLGQELLKAYDAKIVVLLPDEDPNRHVRQVSIEYLKGKQLLIAPPQFFSRERVERAAKEAGFVISVEAQSSSPTALMVLGYNGLGIPVLPDDYPLVGQQRFPYPVLVESNGREISTPVCLHWRSMSELSPATEKFLAVAAKHAFEEQSGHAHRQTYYSPDVSSQ